MKWLLLTLCLLLPSPAWASYTLILWDWSQGAGGSIDGFHVKCGQASGNYTVTITVNDPAARSVSIYTATNNQRGQWFCTVDAFSAANGTSGNGNEVQFVLQFLDPGGGFGGF